MAKLTYIFAQVFAASCLLAFVSPFPTGIDDLKDEFQDLLDPVFKIYQTAVSDDLQEQLTQYFQQEQQLPFHFTQEQEEYIKNFFAQLNPGNLNNDLIQQLVEHLKEMYNIKDDSAEESTTIETPTTTTPQTTEQVNDDNDDDSNEESTTAIETSTTTIVQEEQKPQETDDSDEESTTTIKTPTSTTQGTSEQVTDDNDDDSDEESTTTTTEAPTPTTQGTTEQVTDDKDDDSDEDSTTVTETPTSTTQGTTEQVTDDDNSSEESTTTTETPTSTTQETTERVTDDDNDHSEELTTTIPQRTTKAESDDNDDDSDDNDDSDEVSTSTTHSPTTTSEKTSTITTPKPSTTPTPETTTTTTKMETTPKITTTTTQKTTTVKPSLEICIDCVILHGVGYAPFPGYCDAYIQCRFYGDIPTAASIRRCPSGLYWNQDKLTCDFEENVKCTPVNNCPNHKAIDGDLSAYLIFNGQNWIREPCPSGTSYNSITCGCTDKHDNDDSSGENCQDKMVIPGDKTGFLQLTGNGWVRMPCPSTVGYNEQTCQCTDRLTSDNSNNNCPDKKSIPDDKHGFLQFNGISWIRQPCPATLAYNPQSCVCTYDVTDDDDSGSKDDDLCKPTVKLTFDNNDASDSSINQFWVNNTDVTFDDGKAVFNGKSRLTIPGLSNMEFGNIVYIFITYRQSFATTAQTLVANGDCQVRQSLAVCASKESVNFYAETKEQLTLAKVTVPVNDDVWQNAVYALDKDYLEGSVGTNKVTQPVKGALDRRQKGLVIGGGGDCDNFQGSIDEIQVFLCKPHI